MTDPVERLTAALADRYVIERELGQGGMATVYLAHDVRHDRRVALKVLRPELAAILGGERFLQEIRTTANLQHPHILSLFDSGEADGLVYYVMPYVEGESLRDRLNREKQLPVDESVRIAREVLDALQYAHEHQIVHRDIKPENILLHGGHAMVADFGIALAAAKSEGGSRMTETGMSLGTPAYMAPEQAMGEREITPRADLYALGVVLYEMLTGEPPFTGPTAQAIVARMMTEQPRGLTIQRHTIPPHVEAAVAKSLEKLPADRFASAAEFIAALGDTSFAPTRATMAVPARGRRRWLERLALPAAVLVTFLAAGPLWNLLRTAPAPLVRRYGLSLPPNQTPLPERRFAISPDGARIVYPGPGPGTSSQLWIKESNRYDATPLGGTAGVTTFAFSPDGTWLAFVQSGVLKKVPVQGGAAIPLTDSVGGNAGLTWGDDGTIVYIGRGNGELRRISDVGGASTMVWSNDTGNVRYPVLLPGGRGVLFDRCLGSLCRFEHSLWVLDLRSGTAARIQPGAVLGLYARTGHIIYAREDGGLFALPFDARGLKVTGPGVPVLDSVAVVNSTTALIALSDEGTLVMRTGTSLSTQPDYQMVWVDRAGRTSAVDTNWTFRHTVSGANVGWSLSPDGRRVAIGLSTDAGDDIWIKQLPHGPLSRLTFDSSAEFRPRWSPDGRMVDYIGVRGTFTGAYRRPADGTGAEETVLALPQTVYEVVRSRDNRWLVARLGGTLNVAGNRDLQVMQVGVDTVPRPLLASRAFDESAAALSPDGRWIAYESDESGRAQVYVRPFPNVDTGKWQVSISGGVAPHWSPNGRELFFVDPDRNMVTASIGTGVSLAVGERTILFRLGEDIYQPQTEHYTTYEVAADGRFLMSRRIRSSVSAAAVPMVVVNNWFEELRQKVARR